MDVKINFQTVAPFTSSVIIIDCAFGMYNHIFVIHGLCSIANIYNILMRVEGLNINNNGKVQKNLKDETPNIAIASFRITFKIFTDRMLKNVLFLNFN